LALVAVVAAWLFHVSLRELFPNDRASLFSAIERGLLATVPMLAAFWVLVNSNWPMLRQLREQVEWLITEMFPSGNIAQFATVAVLAGVGEELLFRGTLQTALAHWTTPLIGLAITSVLFGLAHAMSKLYFVFAVVVGVFLGWMTLRYNDLVAPIVAHGLYDFLALAYLSRHKQLAAQGPAPATDETPRPGHD
jgi:membrane protease YdiL (CAAX protease family)